MGFVVPDDSRLSFDILIPPEEAMGARMGFVVVVELTQRPTRRTKAVGKIVEVLGDNMGTGMAVDMALRTHEIPYIWPKAVEKADCQTERAGAGSGQRGPRGSALPAAGHHRR